MVAREKASYGSLIHAGIHADGDYMALNGSSGFLFASHLLGLFVGGLVWWWTWARLLDAARSPLGVDWPIL